MSKGESDANGMFVNMCESRFKDLCNKGLVERRDGGYGFRIPL